MPIKQLYDDLINLVPVVPLAQNQFIFLSDFWPHGIVSACPLTNLVLSKGFRSFPDAEVITQVYLLEHDDNIDEVIVDAIHYNYDVPLEDINNFINVWDNGIGDVDPTIEILQAVVTGLETASR